MKKPLFFAIPMLVLLFSCSVEENVVEQHSAIPEWDNEALAKALADTWKDIDINYQKLFDYSTIMSASEETKRAFGFITKDLQEELAKRTDSDHAYISFTLHDGKAFIGSVQFGNETEGIFTEYISLNSNGIRPYVYFTHNLEFYNQNKDFDKKYYREIILSTNENRSLEEFIRAKLVKPDGTADFKVYVSASSSKLYGYVDQL